MNKADVIQAALVQLDSELQTILTAAQVAREAATHEENKAEDQYDTRGLEASYLASAQAERALQIQHTMTLLRGLPLQSADEIGLGSLIELESNGKKSSHLVAPQGGGLSFKVEGRSIQVVTPVSPLGSALMGRTSDEEIEVEVQGQLRSYWVKSVY